MVHAESEVSEQNINIGTRTNVIEFVVQIILDGLLVLTGLHIITTAERFQIRLLAVTFSKNSGVTI